MEYILNDLHKDENAKKYLSFLAEEEVKKARAFHESFPEYSITPLYSLKSLAAQLGVGGIYVKDESFRFGLNAFKVLGGSFAVAKYMAKELNMDIGGLPYKKLVSPEIRQKLGNKTFVTATDGNHGKGVAWTANKLKQKSAVFMPQGSSKKRLESILAEGGIAEITPFNYDDAVRYANDYAKKTGGIIIQDTAWEGYEEIPKWIMQGYATISLEVIEQLKDIGIAPTHMFTQAGVGSFAAAMIGCFENAGLNLASVVVEAQSAQCFYESALLGTGNSCAVTGEMNTIMAGLACGEVNRLAWDIIKNYSKAFVSCPDYIAANGMRILGAPLCNDNKIISGESGAVTLGLLYEIMEQNDLSKTSSKCEGLKEQLRINKESHILLFSTEGNTDPEMYKRILWQGAYGKI